VDLGGVIVHVMQESTRRLHAENPKGGLVIQADMESKVEKVLAIMDAARTIGISQVAIAGEDSN
jgi:biopolymer transport protein ExbD